MLTILPVTVCTSVAQPTEQYGHTLGVVFAFLMRSSCARASVGARLAPSPARPPSAVPPAMPEDTFKKFRRETSINTPLPVELVERAFTVPVRPSWFDRGEPAAPGQRHRLLAVIDEQRLDLAAVAGVDEAGRVQQRHAVAQRQARARQHEAGEAGRDRDGDAGGHEGPRARRQRDRGRRIEVEPRIVVAGVGGQGERRIHLLNFHVGGPDMTPPTPRRSERPGKPGALLDLALSHRWVSVRSRSDCTIQLERRRMISIVSCGRLRMSQSRRSFLMTSSSTSDCATMSAERGALRKSAISPSSSPSPIVPSNRSSPSNVRCTSTMPEWMTNASPAASLPSFITSSPALKRRRSRSPSVRFL